MRAIPDFEIEKNCGYKIVAGVDEAGRGPLCGPVVAGAVVFKKYDFDDIIISIKSSDVKTTIQACTIAADKCNYPFHLGIKPILH